MGKLERLNFTKTSIEALKHSDKPYTVGDSEVQWLTCRVGKTKKTFYFDKKVEGKRIEAKIGDAALMNPALARKKVLEMVGRASSGHDPRKPPKVGVTLSDAWRDYQKDRELKPNTIRSYQLVFDNHLSHMMDLPIDKIDGDNVREIHRRVGADGHKAYANQIMRTLRAVLNYAKAEYKNDRGERLILENPVSRISETKTWYRERRRKTVIRQADMAAWLKQIDAMENRIVADYFLLLLLTGLRREEATSLRWENVDMQSGLFSVPGDVAKNHDDHTLPMTPKIREIFQRRLDKRVNGYVFPGADGHVQNTRRQRDSLVKKSGVVFTPHDLRRTFTTTAESLDVSAYTLKRLLNHRTDTDVTAGYITWSPQRLLKPLQDIETCLLKGS